jgi:ketosteroid isomerase-like protein
MEPMNASSNDIRDAVSRAQDSWNAAFNRGDAGAVAALYTDNAAVLPPSHVIIKGAAAIRDFWQGLIRAGLKEHGIEMIDAEADGGFAFTTGAWWATGPGEAGKSERFGGTVVTVMRRQGDGSWKVCLHTWN